VRPSLFNNSLSVITITFLLTSFGCEKKYDQIIDSIENSPLISDSKLSLSVVNTDSINIGSERKPEDLLAIQCQAFTNVIHPDGHKYIESVRYSVINIDYTLIEEGVLLNDGILPDACSSDSTYSGNIKFRVKRSVVGTYYVNLWSESTSGYKSNSIMLPIQIVRLNHPPIIYNLQAVDTLARGSELKLIVQISDIDGLSDIYSVGFITRKPDGNFANNGNLIPMFDDGKTAYPSGDETSNDGIYTYTTSVPIDALLGSYTYSFYALDRSRASSDTIIHRIVIKQ